MRRYILRNHVKHDCAKYRGILQSYQFWTYLCWNRLLISKDLITNR